MGYRTVTVDVDVYVDDVINEMSDQELFEELKRRKYTAIVEPLDREDYDYLLDILDKQPFHWYNNRVRDKLFQARNKEYL